MDEVASRRQGTPCIPNIGPQQRRKRLLFGVVLLAIGTAAAVLLIATSVHPGWRLPLFLLFWGGAVGVFQAREKT